MTETRDIVTHRGQELLDNCITSFGYKSSIQLTLVYHPFSMAQQGCRLLHSMHCQR